MSACAWNDPRLRNRKSRTNVKADTPGSPLQVFIETRREWWHFSYGNRGPSYDTLIRARPAKAPRSAPQ
jgi:hypothetical protein